jgi:hypothetical protein
MIQYYGIVRQSARRVARASRKAIKALSEGRIEQEPHFTDRLIAYIEDSMSNFELKGVRWSAKTLTPNTQEPIYGADFMGVLNVALPDFHVSKGFLAQAKLVRERRPFYQNDIRGLQEQCEKMLCLSPDSFVFLYSQEDIRVVPAIAVMGTNMSPTELYSWDIATFFEKHFESFIGDRAIASPTPDTLVSLQRRYDARTVLYLQATERTRETQHE